MTEKFNNIITEEIDAADKIINQDGTINFNSFSIKETLNPDIFENDKLKPEIRKYLLDIYNSIIKESVLLKKEDISDVVIVGSIVSFHYSSYSDIDFHIIIDMKKLNSDYDLVKKFLDDERRLWNIEHHVELNGYDLEIYFQDIKEKNVSNGCYSVLNDKWVKYPDKETYVFDKKELERKALNLIENIEELNNADSPDYEYANKLWNKIVKGRKEDINDNGEFSEGNILFKILRRTGHIEILKNIINVQKDKEMSLTESLCTISPDMEKSIRDYVDTYLIPSKESKEMSEYYKRIISDIFGNAAYDSFTNEELNILTSIIDDEYVKNGGKTDLDGIKAYEKNKRIQLSKLNKKINSENKMKLNIKDFNNTLMESVKDYCIKNNTKEIKRSTFKRLIECSLGEDDNNEEKDCEEISEDNKELAIIHVTAVGRNRAECSQDVLDKMKKYIHDMNLDDKKILGLKYKDVSKENGKFKVELVFQIEGVTGDDIYLDEEKDELKECVKKVLKECDKFDTMKEEEVSESILDDTTSDVTDRRKHNTREDIVSLAKKHVKTANDFFDKCNNARVLSEVIYNEIDHATGKITEEYDGVTIRLKTTIFDISLLTYIPIISKDDYDINCTLYPLKNFDDDNISLTYDYIKLILDKSGNNISDNDLETIYKYIMKIDKNNEDNEYFMKGLSILLELYRYILYIK